MGLKYFFADFELIGAVFCVIAAIYLIVARSVIRKQYMALALLETAAAVMLFFDAFAWFYRGVPGDFAFWVVTVSNFGSFVATAFLQVFYIHYAVLSVDEENTDYAIVFIISVVAWSSVAFIIINQFNGFIYTIDPATNLYSRGPGFGIYSAIVMAESAIAVVYLFINRKKLGKSRFIALLSFIFLPILGGIIQLFIYGYSLSNLLCMASAFIILAQTLNDNARTLIDQEIRINKQNFELSQMRTRIALSQIRPEFLYDALDSVYKLCDEEPERAKELVVHLENYLRENIESIDKDALIPFGRELEHTRVFLAIEKFKYGDRFTVDYDIDTTGFELPPLTVQPIVENAIRHGISLLPPEEEGHIRISTIRGNGYVKVQVTDNGAGFDMNQYNSDDAADNERIGIKNVKERLKAMEDAELHVWSRPGEGTQVDIIIPTRGQ